MTKCAERFVVRSSKCHLIVFAVAMGICATVDGQIPAAPAAPPAASAAAAAGATGATTPPTIFDFLGVPQIARGVVKIGKATVNTARRLLPVGDPPPPLGHQGGGGSGGEKTDEQKSPGEKSVEQNLKAKKAAKADAQAIEFLASVGCGECNPDVEETLYNGLASCFPAVRAAAARTVRIASCSGCPDCNQKSCCSQRIRERLMKLGYGVDHNGCMFEQDPEVSRQCRLAFQVCQCSPLEETTLEPFTEGPPSDVEYLPPPLEKSATLDSAENKSSAIKFASLTKQGRVPWARVNNEPIYRAEILRRIESQILYDNLDEGEKKRQQLIAAELESAIDNRLIVQRARQSHFAMIGDRDSFTDELERDAAIAEQYLQKLQRSHPVTPQQIADHFSRHRRDYVKPAEVLVEELRIPVDTESQAKQVVEYLMNPKGRKPGSPLPIRRSELTPRKPRWIEVTEIENAGMFEYLGNLRRGELSRVLPAKRGYRVFRVLGRRPERPMTLEEATTLVAEDAIQARTLLARENLVRFLRQRSDFWDVQSGVKMAKNRDLRPNR